MSLTFACVLRSGGVYNDAWVARIFRQAREHLKPSEVVCLTDSATCHFEAPRPLLGYQFRAPRLIHNWPGWFSKLELFRPGLFHGPTLYLDLDSLILRPMPGLGSGVHRLMMLDDLFQPARPASGMMLWRPSPATERIYEEFKRDPKAAMATRHGDGGFIGRFPHDRIQKAWPGMVGSYKANRLQNGPGGFAVCCFHGKPKQSDLPPESWARKIWEGTVTTC